MSSNTTKDSKIIKKNKKIATLKGKLIEEVKIPLMRDWNVFIEKQNLTVLQAINLKYVIMHVKKDIKNYNTNRRKRAPRDELETRLELIRNALNHLQYEINRNLDLMPQFLPSEALAHIGRATSIATVEKVTTAKISTISYDNKIKRFVLENKPLSILDIDVMLQPARETAGLNCGSELFKNYIDGICEAIETFCELNSLNQGGASSRASRHYLMYRLAQSYKEIFGEKVPISRDSKFVRLCSDLLPMCKISARGVAAKAEEITKLVRIEQGDYVNSNREEL
jgi:hypothetical protein